MDFQGLANSIVRKMVSPDRHDEALSFAQEGLIRAADRFDPEAGFKFVTFAQWHIRGHVIDGMFRRRSKKKQAERDIIVFGDINDTENDYDYHPEDNREETAESWAIKNEAWEIIERFLDSQQYQAIVHRFRSGLGYREVGNRLGVSESQAWQIVKRALNCMLIRIPNLALLFS